MAGATQPRGPGGGLRLTIRLALVLSLAATFAATSQAVIATGEGADTPAALAEAVPVAAPRCSSVEDCLAQMTLDEKIGQMTQVEPSRPLDHRILRSSPWARCSRVVEAPPSPATRRRTGRTWSMAIRRSPCPPAWASPSSTASTPSTGTTMSTAPRSSLTISAWCDPKSGPGRAHRRGHGQEVAATGTPWTSRPVSASGVKSVGRTDQLRRGAGDRRDDDGRRPWAAGY